jgi:hypothetical protein
MSNSYISFDLLPSDHLIPLGAEVWINQEKIFDTDSLTELVKIRYEFVGDDEQQYNLRLVLKNKQPEHTKIDTDGNITSDSMIVAQNFELEEIDITHIVHDKMQYQHDFNGSGNTVTEKFYGALGCNGIASMTFFTPIYVWLLDQM